MNHWLLKSVGRGLDVHGTVLPAVFDAVLTLHPSAQPLFHNPTQPPPNPGHACSPHVSVFPITPNMLAATVRRAASAAVRRAPAAARPVQRRFAQTAAAAEEGVAAKKPSFMDSLPKHPDYQGVEAVVRYFLPHNGQVRCALAATPSSAALPPAAVLCSSPAHVAVPAHADLHRRRWAVCFPHHLGHVKQQGICHPEAAECSCARVPRFRGWCVPAQARGKHLCPTPCAV